MIGLWQIHRSATTVREACNDGKGWFTFLQQLMRLTGRGHLAMNQYRGD
jgi:hypothetical protein